MKKRKKVQPSHHLHYLAIVAVVAIVAIVLLIMNYARLSAKDHEALAGAARYQAAPQDSTADIEKTRQELRKLGESIQSKIPLSLLASYTKRTLECPPLLYPSKQNWENIPDEFHLQYLQLTPAVSTLGNSIKFDYLVKFHFRLCDINYMRCGYQGVSENSGEMGIVTFDVKDCVNINERSCSCLAKP